ncbi:hypothetical protein ACWEP8_37200 [Streptomyces hydrogenans]
MTDLPESERTVRLVQAHAAIVRGLSESHAQWVTSGRLRRPAFDFDLAADYVVNALGDQAAEILADGTLLRSLTTEDGALSLELEPATDILKLFVASMRGVLDGYGAENYVETEMTAAPSVSMDVRHGSDPLDSYTVTVQRRTNPTPHEFRVRAEERAEKAEANLLRSERRRKELGDESLRRGRKVVEYAERTRALERQVEDLRDQFGAEMLRAGHAEADLEALRGHLRYVLDYQGPGHAHVVPGRWDADGSPCDHCARLAAARTALEDDETCTCASAGPEFMPAGHYQDCPQYEKPVVLSPGGVACARCSWSMTGGSVEEQQAALAAHTCTSGEGETR